MSDQKHLDPNKKLDIEELLKNLKIIIQREKGGFGVKAAGGVDMGPFHYRNMSEPLKATLSARRKVFRHIG